MYSGHEEAWTAEPESVLVSEVEGLSPRRALDLGCGIGINALWLAKMGWEVTGVDWAESAIGKARTAATRESLEVGADIRA